MGKPTIYEVVRVLEKVSHSKDQEAVRAMAQDLLLRIYHYDGIDTELKTWPSS